MDELKSKNIEIKDFIKNADLTDLFIYLFFLVCTDENKDKHIKLILSRIEEIIKEREKKFKNEN